MSSLRTPSYLEEVYEPGFLSKPAPVCVNGSQNWFLLKQVSKWRRIGSKPVPFYTCSVLIASKLVSTGFPNRLQTGCSVQFPTGSWFLSSRFRSVADLGFFSTGFTFSGTRISVNSTLVFTGRVGLYHQSHLFSYDVLKHSYPTIYLRL
ncbi:hypothetical protein Hanom_Chr03g00249791 [Helianthus anomalus]